MRVLLVIPTYCYAIGYPKFMSNSDFPVGFAYVASALKRANHEVIGLNPNNDPGYRSAREMLNARLEQSIREHRPELIGVGGLCTDYAFLRDAIQIIRRLSPRTPIVCGGGVVNNDAEFIFSILQPDFCIIGEGEEIIVQLADMIESGRKDFEQINNIGYWGEGKPRFTRLDYTYPEIDSRGFPDYSPFDIDVMLDECSMAARYLYRYTRPHARPMTIVAARGCPFSCSFCVHNRGIKYRARSIENIMEEIRVLYEEYQFNILIILDELFAVNKQRLKNFCNALREGKKEHGWDFDWLFQTHASAALDREALEMAKAEGCYYFSYGIESASPTVLASMNKKAKPEQISEAIRISEEVRIGFGGNFIFGDIAETQETIAESLAFFKEHCLNSHVFFCDVRPYPGSKLFEYCMEKGIIVDKRRFYETIDVPAINMTSMPDAVWWPAIRQVLSLQTFPFVQATEATWVKRELPIEVKPRMLLENQHFWSLTAPCPHCGAPVTYRDAVDEPAAEREGISLITGCTTCNRRLRINASRDTILKSLSSMDAELPPPISIIDIKDKKGKDLSIRRPSILFISLEFPNWARARSWSYTAHIGLEEGFSANNVEYLTLPSPADTSPGDPSSWLSTAMQLCAGKCFDQVWVEVVHSRLDEASLRWIKSMAPVRVAMICESLQYKPEVYAALPHLRGRRELVEQRLQYMTHALAVDEKDAAYLDSRGMVRALWWVGAVPERYIRECTSSPEFPEATFHGALYGARSTWLEHPSLRPLVTKCIPIEESTPYPKLFDSLQALVGLLFNADNRVTRELLECYMEPLRYIRRECFRLWIKGLRQGCAVVNLPSYFQGYAGRVVEGMAAGRPVISWRAPDRPKTLRLFADGKEILLFPKDDPGALAEHILRIQRDKEFADHIASNARLKLWRFHTMEKRVQQILNWIETEAEPTYEEKHEEKDLSTLLQRFLHCCSSIRRIEKVPAAIAERAAASSINESESARDHFYRQLFIHDPNWSTPHPNEDEQARWACISSMLDKIQLASRQSSLRILDLGCGRGWLTKLASRYGRTEGVDPVGDVINIAGQHFPDIQFTHGTAESILERSDFEPYDVVLSSEVIEHIPKHIQYRFAEDIAKLVRHGGYSIITTPRGEVYDTWMQYTNFFRQPVEDWLNEQELENLFKRAGFRSIAFDRISFDTNKKAFLANTPEDDAEGQSVVRLYQVWGFRKGSLRIS